MTVDTVIEFSLLLCDLALAVTLYQVGDDRAVEDVEYLYSVASVDEFGIEGPSVSLKVVTR